MREVENAQEISNAFAQHFQLVYDAGTTQYSNISSGYIPDTGNLIAVKIISCKEVEAVVKQLKPKRSLGPDRILPYIYTYRVTRKLCNSKIAW